MLIGMSPVSGIRFALLNGLGAVLWACVVGGVGWTFGQAAEIVLGDIRHLEVWLLLGIVAVAAIGWLVRKRRVH